MIKGILDIENSLSFHEKKLRSKMMKYNIQTSQMKKVYELEVNEYTDTKSFTYDILYHYLLV